MSRRTNILLILALAAIVAYGRFGVPFFLPMVSDDAPVDEGQPVSEADEVRHRMRLLRPGAHECDVERILGLADKPPPALNGVYVLDPNYVLWLTYDRNQGLVRAELYQGEQLVRRGPATK
jgi:hypothetical protein